MFQTMSVHPSPKGGRGCLMSPPCLESRGCHLIPLCYLLSCSSAQSCYPFCLIVFCLLALSSKLFPENFSIFFVKRQAFLYGSCLTVSQLVLRAQSTTKDYIRAEQKFPSISKSFISQVIMPQVIGFYSLFIFRGHSAREPATSRVTYFILQAYTGTKKIGRGLEKMQMNGLEGQK